MVDLLFFATAKGRHTRCVVPFIVCALESNPNAAVELLVDSPSRWDTKRINEVFPGRVLIRTIPKGVSGKFARWLVKPKTKASMVYIGDVDIAVTDDRVVEWHLENMAKLGLPYSNAMRPGEPTTRMSGLHAVLPEKWYTTAWKQKANKYLAKKLKGGTGNDERLLASLAKEIVGVLPPVYTPENRPVHGIHFSGARTWAEKNGRKVREITPEKVEKLRQIQAGEAWAKLSDMIEPGVFIIPESWSQK